MTNKKSYAHLQAELDTILEKFERSGHDDVDDLLVDYEKGIKLINSLNERLEQAEISLKKIKK